MSVGGKEMLAGGEETAEGLGMGAREKRPYWRPREECWRNENLLNPYGCMLEEWNPTGN
jgi:hypothetical protein